MEDLDGTLKTRFNGTGIQHFTGEALARFEIPLPPLPEQRRIVSILDEVLEGIATAKANTEKNLQNARAIFESHLQSVFSERGSDWIEMRLGDLIDIQNGFAFKSAEYTNSGYFVMRIGNVQNGEIELSNPRYVQISDKRMNRFILNKGDILVSLTGKIGRVGVVESEHLPAVLNQRVARITVKDRAIAPNFLFRFLCSRAFREGLQDAGHGAAQQNVSTKEIETVAIAVPTTETQIRIVEHIDALVEKTRLLEDMYRRKLIALEDLKKSFLYQAFSGDL